MVRIFKYSRSYEYPPRPAACRSQSESQSERTLERAPCDPRRTGPFRRPRPLSSRSNAPICLVHVPCWFTTRHISHSVPVAPCATHLRLAPRAQHVQPLMLHVCKPVHVQCLAVACSDGMGLLGLALALSARADIEVCAVEENAPARQGGSADGMARSWRSRRCSGRSLGVTMEEHG